MAEIAVLTGNLIVGAKLSEPGKLTERLAFVLDCLQRQHPIRALHHQGEQFQLAVNADLALESMLFVRAGLIGRSPSRRQRWDGRVAVALGSESEDLQEDVYAVSRRCLESLDRDHLAFHAPSEPLRLSLGLATAFVNEIIDGWTPSEAEAYFEYLQRPGGHRAIAVRLKKSRPTVTKTLLRARYTLLDRYLRDAAALMEITESARYPGWAVGNRGAAASVPTPPD